MLNWCARHSVGKSCSSIHRLPVDCQSTGYSDLRFACAGVMSSEATSYSHGFAHVCSSLTLICLMHPPLHIHKHPHCKKVRTCSCNAGAYDLRSKRLVTAVDRGVERLPSRTLCCQVLGALQRPETCSRRLFPPGEENKEVSSRTTCGSNSQYSQSRYHKHQQI